MLKLKIINNGFYIVIIFAVIYFSFAAKYFLSIENFFSMLHSLSPVVVISLGMALVILMGKIDISVGSIAFLSVTIGVLLITNFEMNYYLAFSIIIISGMILGAINGFFIVILKINPLITTLGTMFTFRGISLQLTNASVINLPDSLRAIGNLTIGPVFIDTIIMIIFLYILHSLHLNTTFGRHVNAIGSKSLVANTLGINENKITFLCFVLSGLLASVGGILSLLQVGLLSGYLGQGLEFTAVAVVVVGGISLFGGRGKIIPGVLAGAFVFELVRNGLNQIGANPYAYKLITGIIIFVAMYADALKKDMKTN
tara:strand:- start:30 stop:968 length:939 start_codon:yes stop_codon:yes gene_type:complete